MLLDEIGELPLEAQPRDSSRPRRIPGCAAWEGRAEGRKADVRVAAATHARLERKRSESLAASSSARPVLHRLECFVVHVFPRCGERRGDIGVIARELLRQFLAPEVGSRTPTAAAIARLRGPHLARATCGEKPCALCRAADGSIERSAHRRWRAWTARCASDRPLLELAEAPDVRARSRVAPRQRRESQRGGPCRGTLPRTSFLEATRRMSRPPLVTCTQDAAARPGRCSCSGSWGSGGCSRGSAKAVRRLSCIRRWSRQRCRSEPSASAAPLVPCSLSAAVFSAPIAASRAHHQLMVAGLRRGRRGHPRHGADGRSARLDGRCACAPCSMGARRRVEAPARGRWGGPRLAWSACGQNGDDARGPRSAGRAARRADRGGRRVVHDRGGGRVARRAREQPGPRAGTPVGRIGRARHRDARLHDRAPTLLCGRSRRVRPRRGRRRPHGHRAFSPAEGARSPHWSRFRDRDFGEDDERERRGVHGGRRSGHRARRQVAEPSGCRGDRAGSRVDLAPSQATQCRRTTTSSRSMATRGPFWSSSDGRRTDACMGGSESGAAIDRACVADRSKASGEEALATPGRAPGLATAASRGVLGRQHSRRVLSCGVDPPQSASGAEHRRRSTVLAYRVFASDRPREEHTDIEADALASMAAATRRVASPRPLVRGLDNDGGRPEGDLRARLSAVVVSRSCR